jgi:hypothetical protein
MSIIQKQSKDSSLCKNADVHDATKCSDDQLAHTRDPKLVINGEFIYMSVTEEQYIKELERKIEAYGPVLKKLRQQVLDAHDDVVYYQNRLVDAQCAVNFIEQELDHLRWKLEK